MSIGDPLPGFDDWALRDRYCDLILTGGVTSAIAYPAAIFALATAYRFNSIGGSSSGAGAAALAAAAEYRRRHGSSDGFRILLARTADIANEDINRRSGLEWLFQPAAQNVRLFRALVPGVARPQGKMAGLAFGFLRAYAGSIGVGLAFAAGFVYLVSRCCGAQGVIAYAGAALIGGAVAMGVAVWRDIRSLTSNDFGLCSGIDRLPHAQHPPLTLWLHDLIQEIAGRRQGDPPLTFADLAAAPGSPKETLGDLSPPGAVSINLQMFTSNITHGRPYVLPQAERAEKGDEDGDTPLYFRPCEMRRLFPRAVVEHMMIDPVTKQSNRHDGPQEIVEPAHKSGLRRSTEVASTAADDPERAMWRLPRKHLPILVAARMSVGFPVLFTAVPLWALDDGVRPQVFKRCLFSDGSLCSNFPIHLFDSPIPAWPTFGISLFDLPRQDAKVEPRPSSCASAQRDKQMPRGEVMPLPLDHREGWHDPWNAFESRPGTGQRLFGFIGALLSTTKDWNDATLARLPGVRDRVVRVGLCPGIGGLNIMMSGADIKGLARLGEGAARELLGRFTNPKAPGGTADGWNEHRWVRLNVLRECLAGSLAGLTWSAAQARYAKPLREQIRHAIEEAPLQGDDHSQLLVAQAAALDGALTALVQAEQALTAPTTGQPYKPVPRPVMRVRPPL